MNVLLNRDSAVKIQSLLPKKLIGAGILKLPVLKDGDSYESTKLWLVGIS